MSLTQQEAAETHWHQLPQPAASSERCLGASPPLHKQDSFLILNMSEGLSAWAWAGIQQWQMQTEAAQPPHSQKVYALICF